jgi:hypothetical protein
MIAEGEQLPADFDEPLAAELELLLPVADDSVSVGTTNAGTGTGTDGGEGGGGRA